MIDISFPQDSRMRLAGQGMEDLVHLVCLVQPYKRDKPDNSLLPLAGFISALYRVGGARTYRGQIGTAEILVGL